MFVHGFLSFTAVAIIAVCLLVTTTFTLVAFNIEKMVASLASQNEIMIFIDDSVSRAEAIRLQQAILKVPNVKSATFVSKEETFDNYLATLGGDAFIMEELRKDNPLRDGYRVIMHDISLHAQTVKALEAVPEIAATNSQKEISDKLLQIQGIVSAVSYALIGLLGGVSIFIVSNTVKLAMFTRKEEIAIMKMVGATNGFIRAPFVIEGIFLGLAAALLSFFAQWGVYGYIAEKVIGTDLVNLIPFGDFAGSLALLLAGAGLVLGVGGSALTIRRFMKV